MLVSTRGRYALRVMLDLAEQDPNHYVVLMEIAERQKISEKYLEGILATLSRAGMVISMRGRGGGYRLANEPSEYTVGAILKLTETTLAPVACLSSSRVPCVQTNECRTFPMWSKLGTLIDEYFESITLADLMHNESCAQCHAIDAL